MWCKYTNSLFVYRIRLKKDWYEKCDFFLSACIKQLLYLYLPRKKTLSAYNNTPMTDTWTIKQTGSVSLQATDLVLPLELEDSYGNLHNFILHQSVGGHLSLWKGDSLIDVDSQDDIHSLSVGDELVVSVSIPRTDIK